jgi:hypothetical protein
VQSKLDSSSATMGAVQKLETHNRRGKLRLTPTSNLKAFELLQRCRGNTKVIR